MGSVITVTNQGVAGAIVCLMVLVWILFKIQQGSQRKIKKLPPGPSSLPIVGNLHMLGKLPHRTLRDLSDRCGPLMFMRLGNVPTVVVSSPEMAKQFLKTHDLVFASRPPMSAARNMYYSSSDVGFAPYGAYWRQMRKACVFQLLSSKRIESFQSVRAEEVSAMINSVMEEGCKGLNPVNVSKAVSSLTTNIMCRMTFSRRYDVDSLDRGGFRALLKEFCFLLGAFNVGDFIPYLKRMDLQGLVRRQMKVRKTFDAFLENIIEEHERQTNDRNRDFVDGLLAISQDNEMEIKVTRESVKANILQMLAAGTDTSSGTLEWGMSALLKNPWVMKKVQEELEKVIGLNRMVRESDLPRLRYLQEVVKETLRLYPPVPLLVPRESMETCTVSGYEIPAKARVIVNAWAIRRDPKTWEDAEMFKPERFIGSCIDVRGQNFELIPFGGGRRICPGMQLASTVVELALAQLLHCFNWRLPDGMKGDDLDMREQFGLSMPRAVQLLAVPTPRLPIEWMTFGRKYAVDSLVGGGFRALLKEYFFLLGAFNIGDFIPCLERMDLQGLNRRQMKVHRTFDAFLENIIEEHERRSNGVNRDFVDGLLALVQDNDMEIQFTRDNIKANILEMLVAGTDTSSGVLEWGMCALLKNRSVMKKAQEELEKVIGLNRIVHESDLPHLHYLQLVVKEILRLYPPAPLLVPHESMETCSVSGYEIPAKARIIINAWAIGRDPKLWEDAEMFKPERFIGSSIDVKGQNFELIPFGSGRRMCPGIQLATIVTQFALAQLLHCFDWRLPDGMNADDLEMIEEYGLTVAKAVPLHAVPALRLAMDRQI